MLDNGCSPVFLGRPTPLICSTGCSAIFVSSPSRKNISVLTIPKSLLYPPPFRLTEGRIAIVTNAGRNAVDAGGATDESASLRTEKSCGPDAPTLASSRGRQLSRATVAKEPGHRGEHEGSR